MSQLDIKGSALGNSLDELLTAKEIVPGDAPSYQICKTIYSYHPLGLKMVESPLNMAQSQEREVTVAESPEDDVVEAFKREWKKIGADRHIFNTMRLARIYGIASVAIITEDVEPQIPIDFQKLYSDRIGFNVLDPLNTAGSLVLNQDPNSIDFQKHSAIAVSGKPYHRSRACVVMNEDPLYIEYTSSAFGFVGRSVYQRALYPLKSFVQSMVTDDMVTRKAGLLIAMLKSAGSIIDNMMSVITGMKRVLLRQGATNNVLSIGETDKIESLNLQNLDGASSTARKNVLENIAVSADMPAQLLNSETFAEGFGEGSEDAKAVARYIDRVRIQMDPLYHFFDEIVMYRAWNPDFYKTIQRKFPNEYGKMEFNEAFYRWKNSFKALWPSLLKEPESEQVKVEDVKLKAVIALVEVLLPELDPENRAVLIRWAADNFNSLELMFQAPLVLDYHTLEEYEPPKPIEAPKPGDPFSAQDALTEAVARLPDRSPKTLNRLRSEILERRRRAA